MRRVVGMRVLIAAAVVAIVAAMAVAVMHDSGSTKQRQNASTGGSQTGSAPRAITPPRANELRAVLADWARANPHAPAAVGVQVGSRVAVFSTSASLSESARLRLDVPGIAGSMTTPDALMQFSNDVLRAHAHGVHDLASSYFRIAPGGHGRGVDGFANDGFCARATGGCAPGTSYFAVGVVGAGSGGAAQVVYDPGVDVGIVAVSRDRNADLTELVQRALLLTTLGRAGYERAVNNTAHPAPGVTQR